MSREILWTFFVNPFCGYVLWICFVDNFYGHFCEDFYLLTRFTITFLKTLFVDTVYRQVLAIIKYLAKITVIKKLIGKLNLFSSKKPLLWAARIN